MNIFVKRLNILIKTFCVCANGFKALSLLINLKTFNLLLWNYLLTLKRLTKNPSQNSLLCNLSMFFNVDHLFATGKMRQIYLLHATFNMSLQDQRIIGRFLNPFSRSKITALGISTLTFTFLNSQALKNCKNHRRIYRNNFVVCIIGVLKQYSSCDTIPLRNVYLCLKNAAGQEKDSEHSLV